MGINAPESTDADAAARDRRDGESPIFAARREQLERITRGTFKASARREPTMTELGLSRKSSTLPATISCFRLVVCRCSVGVDAEEIDGRVLESGARAERSAEDRRAGGDVGELAADAHDLARVRYAID